MYQIPGREVARAITIRKWFKNVPDACNSSNEKQLPTDSGTNFNLLFDTFRRTNCRIMQPKLDPGTLNDVS